MKILFLNNSLSDENFYKNIFTKLDYSVDFMAFNSFYNELDKLNLLDYDFLFIEINSSDNISIDSFKSFKKEKISFLINIIYIFNEDNLSYFINFTKLGNFDFLLNPISLEEISNKLGLYKNESGTYETYKMALKGKLIRTLEHQWKQPLNFIATNFLNLELKSELGTLSNKDVVIANEKVEGALEEVATSLSNLNICFIESKNKTHFSLKLLFNKVLKLIKPQMEKHEIKLKKVGASEDIELKNYENEYSLLLLSILNLYIQFIIKNKAEVFDKQIEIELNNERKEISFKLLKKVPFLNFLSSFSLELFIIKKLLNKLNLTYSINYSEETTSIILSTDL